MQPESLNASFWRDQTRRYAKWDAQVGTGTRAGNPWSGLLLTVRRLPALLFFFFCAACLQVALFTTVFTLAVTYKDLHSDGAQHAVWTFAPVRRLCSVSMNP